MPPSSTTTSTEPATTIVTFQGTLEVLSEKSASTDYTYYLPPSGDGASIFTLSNVVEVFTTVWAIDVLTSPFSIPTATHLPTTTITVKGTFTVPRAQSPPPGYSLWRPELSEPVSTFSDVVAVYTTIWAIDVESSPEIDLSSAHAASSNATSTHTLASTSSKPYTGGGICDPSPCEPEPTNGTIATTTSKSALCFNAVLQRNMPCSTTSTVSKFDYTPAGASTVGYNGGSGAKEAARAGTLLAMIASLMQILRDLEGLGPAVGFLGL
ncbi:hypothetical protein MMC30_009023 [Trapelia coarctata]|nr:hypothetical protein [Trapelia coarctata]